MIISVLCLCAHMHTLVPDEAWPRKGREVSITYLFCHPFEHEVHETAPPRELFVVDPDGRRRDLLPALTKEGDGYRVRFTPAERGDHYLIMRAPPEESDGTRYHQAAKLILHVQSQVGWDRSVLPDLDIVPLTRPYGLLPGCVFRAQVTWRGKPAAGAIVEVEKYNAEPPRELPDDVFVTGVVKTDDRGVFCAHLPEAGWWSVTAAVPAPAGGERGTPEKHVLSFWLPVGHGGPVFTKPARE